MDRCWLRHASRFVGWRCRPRRCHQRNGRHLPKRCRRPVLERHRLADRSHHRPDCSRITRVTEHDVVVQLQRTTGRGVHVRRTGLRRGGQLQLCPMAAVFDRRQRCTHDYADIANAITSIRRETSRYHRHGHRQRRRRRRTDRNLPTHRSRAILERHRLARNVHNRHRNPRCTRRHKYYVHLFFQSTANRRLLLCRGHRYRYLVQIQPHPVYPVHASRHRRTNCHHRYTGRRSHNREKSRFREWPPTTRVSTASASLSGANPPACIGTAPRGKPCSPPFPQTSSHPAPRPPTTPWATPHPAPAVTTSPLFLSTATTTTPSPPSQS